MKKHVLLLFLFLAMALCGCRVIRIEEEPAQPLEYTVVDSEDIPSAALALIEEKKMGEFRITYRSGEDLYLIRGYGQQMTGGYSIAVNLLTASESGIFFKTTLIGPDETPAGSEPSYPYIVVKTVYQDLPVQFEEGSVRDREENEES
jgi:hypothetical protein